MHANHTGKRFGRLIAEKRVGSDKFGNALWQCRCDCGTTVKKPANLLVIGRVKTCGCWHGPFVHGYARGKRNSVPEYRAWQAMKQRCRKALGYADRGIRVCDRWQSSFVAFLADMGPKPSPKHSIDRINNDGDYEPDNCRWATPSMQMLNRRPRAEWPSVVASKEMQ